MNGLAQIAGEQRGTLTIARISGEVDASNAAWMGKKLRAMVTNRSEVLAVDLTETTYVESAGSAVLFAVASELRQHRQELRLVVTEGSSIARMLSLTGLDSTVPTHPSLAAALGEVGREA